MIAWLAATWALADAPVHLIAGATATAGLPSLGAGAVGRIAFTPFKIVGFEAGARELIATAETRTLGAVFFGLRAATTPASWLRGGFAHHHETPWDVVKDDPVGAIAGIAPRIVHRSGAELGFGVAPPVGGDVLSLGAELSVAVMPDSAGPNAYLFLDLIGAIHLGPRPQADEAPLDEP